MKLTFNILFSIYLLVYCNQVVGLACLVISCGNAYDPDRTILPPKLLTLLLLGGWLGNKYLLENTPHLGFDEVHEDFPPIKAGAWALVTGATGGLGENLCSELADLGLNLIISGRNQGKLDNLAKSIQSTNPKTQVKTLTADLAEVGAGAALAKAALALEGSSIQIDVLVNNAGIAGSYGKFWEQDLKQYTAVNTINNRAPIELTHAFLKVMVPRGRGRILQVASMASFLAGPNEALYHATKAHLRTLSNGLREELSGSGVSVTTLAPGPFKTSFWKSDTKQTVAYLCALVLTPDAALTAKQAVHATMRGRRLMIPGWTMQLTKVLVDVLPLSWGTKVGMIFWVDLPAGVFSLLKKMGME